MRLTVRYVITSLIMFLLSLTVFPKSIAAEISPFPALSPAQQAGVPSIVFTFVPRYGDRNGILYGQVTNINPVQNKIATYIKVNGGWWNKPFAATPTVAIHTDGLWSCDITTGGTDELATDIIAFVIPQSYAPPLTSGAGGLPGELYSNAIAYVQTARSSNDQILGLDYGPYRAGQVPGGSSPTSAQIAEDMALMAQKVQVIRIYGAQGIGATMVAQAQSHGIQVVLQAWIDTNTTNNQHEIDAAISLANAYSNVIAVFVGSEVLMRNDVSEATLIGYITQVHNAVSVPVGYADDDYRWLNHPNLLNVVDWVGLDLYGFWNCIDVTSAAQYTRTQWQNIKNAPAFAGKRILVAETGWPNAGHNANCTSVIGSESAQAQFVNDILSLAQSDSMDLFLFEATDEPWKCNSEPLVGCHWGLLNQNRRPWSAWDKLPDFWATHLIAPADGVITNDPTPTLSWGAVPRTTGYRLQIDDNSDFSSPIINIDWGQTSYTPTISLANGQYYWRVQTHWGNWSNSSIFTVDTTYLVAAPERNFYTTQTPALCWNRVSWATGYVIQVDNTKPIVSPFEFSTTVSPDTLCVTTSSLAVGKHYWWVSAMNGSKQGGWSNIDSFIVKFP